MGQLTGLAGTNGHPRNVDFFRSVTMALELLGRDRCATTSGSYGAINIWMDDEGQYRGERMSFGTTESETVVKTKRALRKWLIRELPLVESAVRWEVEK